MVIMKSIDSEDDYLEALIRVSMLMDSEVGTADGNELDALATLIDSYEKIHYPIG